MNTAISEDIRKRAIDKYSKAKNKDNFVSHDLSDDNDTSSICPIASLRDSLALSAFSVVRVRSSEDSVLEFTVSPAPVSSVVISTRSSRRT